MRRHHSYSSTQKAYGLSNNYGLLFSATIATTTISAHAQRGTDGAGERLHMLLGTGGSLQSKRFHAASTKTS